MQPEVEAAAARSEGDRPVHEIRLYEKWRKLYPLWVKGRMQRLRRTLLVVLLLVFYVSPWLTWNGRQGVWLDIPARKFTIFWTTFYPQELVLLSWLLIIAAFSLFFFTVIAGRLWCGYACPQTVWTLCYQWIERKVEGNRNQRIKLDRGPWNARRLRIKATKWSLWALLSLSIGLTFVAYFVPPPMLIEDLASGQIAGWEAFWIFFPAAGFYLLSGVLREQVCLHMCPYARFQSVMFDKDTMIVSYDAERGEPRGPRSHGTVPGEKGLGACVDCKLCVHACPTGIDIRDGLQYECIGCAQCIDVCNDVMHRMGYAPNLIRYSSEHEDQHQRRTWLRPRLVGYGVVLLAMLMTFSWTIAHRVPLSLDIIRDRNRLYRELWDGSVENVYTLKVMNRESTDRSYRLSATGDLPVDLVTRLDDNRVLVPAGEQVDIPVQLRSGPDALTGGNSRVDFTVESLEPPIYSVTEASRFVAPEPGAEPTS